MQEVCRKNQHADEGCSPAGFVLNQEAEAKQKIELISHQYGYMFLSQFLRPGLGFYLFSDAKQAFLRGLFGLIFRYFPLSISILL